MAFKLKSGNTTSFKNMGSSPVKQMTDFSNVTIDGEDAETVKKRNEKERQDRIKKKEQEMTDLISNPDKSISKEEIQQLGENRQKKKEKSPAKQRTIKNPTGDKMIMESGNVTNDNMFIKHDPNRPGGPVPLPSPSDSSESKTIKDLRKRSEKKSPAKQYKQPTGPKAEIKPEKLRTIPMTNEEMEKDDFIRTRISEGSIESQALRRKENKKQVSKAKMKAFEKIMKSPTKQTDTTYADGTKKSKREQDFAERYTAENAKDKYWYKIDGKKATKAQYIKYKNIPGNMEGGGKQTNDPTVSLAKQSGDKRKSPNKIYSKPKGKRTVY